APARGPGARRGRRRAAPRRRRGGRGPHRAARRDRERADPDRRPELDGCAAPAGAAQPAPRLPDGRAVQRRRRAASAGAPGPPAPGGGGGPGVGRAAGAGRRRRRRAHPPRARGGAPGDRHRVEGVTAVPTDAALLQEVPFFQLMDEQERTALAGVLDVVRVPANQVVFHYNDPGDALYIIRAGSVEIFVTDDTGKRIVLETAAAGDYFGEISLLDRGPRTASVVATQDLEALRLDGPDREQFLNRYPSAGLDMLAVMGRRLRASAEQLRHTASRNVNEEMEDRRTIVQKSADWIAEFSGSMTFLVLNAAIFLVWIVVNTDLVPHVPAFDPFPFGLLTMAVSLEAIFLSIFVLISQNRMAAKDRIRADIEYDVNLKAELEVAHLHQN